MVNAPPLVNIMAFLFIGAIMLVGATALLFPARLARALAKFTYSVYVRQDNGRDVWKYWGFDWQWHPYSREESMRLLKTAMREPEGGPIVIHSSVDWHGHLGNVHVDAATDGYVGAVLMSALQCVHGRTETSIGAARTGPIHGVAVPG